MQFERVNWNAEIICTIHLNTCLEMLRFKKCNKMWYDEAILTMIGFDWIMFWVESLIFKISFSSLVSVCLFVCLSDSEVCVCVNVSPVDYGLL